MKRKALKNIISLILALSIIFTVGILTAFAEPEDGGDTAAQAEDIQQNVPEDNAQENVQDNAQDQQGADVQTQPEAEPQAQPEVQPEVTATEPVYAPIYEYIYGREEDATSAYEEPQYLGELPTVNSGAVVEATAVAIPEVAVSDASIFSGAVMWLCVALGIAVLVGVLVSKRTRRRGA